MSTGLATAAVPKPRSPLGRFFSAENRYLSPLFITLILLVGNLSFGLLESFSRTLLAIGAALALEIVLGRWFWGKIPNLASAYITGISVGILLRSPEYWPYALCSAIAITSKYAIRVRGRHIWNPSNFAICAMLVVAPEFVAALSIQWGNTVWPMVVIWVLGAFIVYRVERFHITATYVASFVVLALLRTPITGPMYQLFIFFMITDPKTTVTPKWAQCLVAGLVAVAELFLRLAHVVNAPFFALTIVGPAAMLFEIWRKSSVTRTQ
jgi:hypothetical protein